MKENSRNFQWSKLYDKAFLKDGKIYCFNVFATLQEATCLGRAFMSILLSGTPCHRSRWMRHFNLTHSWPAECCRNSMNCTCWGCNVNSKCRKWDYYVREQKKDCEGTQPRYALTPALKPINSGEPFRSNKALNIVKISFFERAW